MDGLWGMAYSALNGGNPTVIDQLVSAGMPTVFSMCFNEPSVGNAGGYLVMGGIDTSMHTGTVQYTPILLKRLSSCRPKEVPQHSEKTMPAVTKSNKADYIKVLEKRMEDLSGGGLSRVKKVIKQVSNL